MNKRGSLDNAAVLVGLFVIAIAIWAGWTVVNIGATAFAGSTDSVSLMNNAATMFSRMGNSGFLFMTIGLFLFNIIGAFLLFTHPVFAIIDILFMPISIMIAALISNAYETTIYTLTGITTFTVMNYIMLNLPTIIIIVDVLCAIAAYAIYKTQYG